MSREIKPEKDDKHKKYNTRERSEDKSGKETGLREVRTRQYHYDRQHQSTDLPVTTRTSIDLATEHNPHSTISETPAQHITESRAEIPNTPHISDSRTNNLRTRSLRGKIRGAFEILPGLVWFVR